MEIAYSGDAFHTYMVISSEEWGENEDEEKMMSNQSRHYGKQRFR